MVYELWKILIDLQYKTFFQNEEQPLKRHELHYDNKQRTMH